MLSVSVFVSHSWKHSNHYDKIKEWVFDDDWQVDGLPLVFRNTSVPKDSPIHHARNDRELANAIFERIKASDVVLIPTGMYSTHSKWIKIEIWGVNKLKVPIVGVNPWGQQRKSSVVAHHAKDVIGWKQSSIGTVFWALVRIVF